MPAGIVAFVFGLFAFFLPQSVERSLFVTLRSPSPEATILFGGDIMLDRWIRTVSERQGGSFIFSCVDKVLQDADLVVTNLEGPVTGFPSTSASSTIGSLENMTFTFATSTPALLARHNIRMVNVGNNHFGNFGEEGMRSTMVHLAEYGIGFFGSPLQSSLTRRTVEGVPFEFISYNEFGGGGDGELVRHLAEYARKEGFIPVVYTHWGDEYATTSPERVQTLARGFIDAGAEIVIGSHPHVVQEHEVYRGKHIYYSLGNFVFDQYWNDDVRTGLLVRVSFDKNSVRDIEEIPIEMLRDGRTCPVR